MSVEWKKPIGWKSVIIGVSIALALVLVGQLLTFIPNPNQGYSELSTGQKTLIIAHRMFATPEVLAAADYTCTGVNDNVTIQTAINALPAIGGKLQFLAGNYSFGATVSRAIDNVTIAGVGRATYFAYDGGTAIFSAGVQSGWSFQDFRTDAGGVTVTTSYEITNCWLGATYVSWKGTGLYAADVLPSANNTYDLGSPTAQWAEIYAGPNSLHVGARTITDNATQLRIDGYSIPRTATYVVATSDAMAREKAQSDDTLTGTNDYVKLQAAISALPQYATLAIVGKTVQLGATGVTVGQDLYWYSPGITYEYSGTGTAISLIADPAIVSNLGNEIPNSYDFGRILATGAAVSSATAAGLHIQGLRDSDVRVRTENFAAGYGVKLVTDLANLRNVESNRFRFFSRECKTGIYLSGDWGFAYNQLSFNYILYTGSTTADYIVIDAQDNTYNANGWLISDLNIWPSNNLEGYGIKGSHLKHVQIKSMIVDGGGIYGNGFVPFYDYSPTISLDSVVYSAANLRTVPFPGAYNSGSLGWYPVDLYNWTTLDAGGVHSVSNQMFYATNNGTGTAVVGGGYSGIGCYVAGIGWNSQLTWKRPIGIRARFVVDGSNTTVVRRFQLKDDATEGALVDEGVGLRWDNYNLYAETYGSALESVDTGIVCTDGLVYDVTILHQPPDNSNFGGHDEFHIYNAATGVMTTTVISGAAASDNGKIPRSSGKSGRITVTVSGNTTTSAYLRTGNIQVFAPDNYNYDGLAR